MATADDYTPIEVDPSDPRVHLADGPVPPAQEPLPAVPGPFPVTRPEAQQPSSSQGAWDPAWQGLQGRQYSQSGRNYGKAYGQTSTLTAGQVMLKYPPPGPNWKRWGNPATIRVDTTYQTLPMQSAGSSWQAVVQIPMGVVVVGEWLMDHKALWSMTSPTASMHEIMCEIAQDFGGAGLVVDLDIYTGLYRVQIEWIAP